jgi:hypothetical protein
MPGNEDAVGDPPMCADALGMQWFKDLLEGKLQPTNTAPGLCYMLCCATQHSNTNAHDKTSPALLIGPHWMILWPFDATIADCPGRRSLDHVCRNTPRLSARLRDALGGQ